MYDLRPGIPVLLLSYGAIGELQLPVFADSLRRLAEPLGRQARAEALLDAIDASLAELATRMADAEPVPAYIGGISLKGQQGLASTQGFLLLGPRAAVTTGRMDVLASEAVGAAYGIKVIRGEVGGQPVMVPVISSAS